MLCKGHPAHYSVTLLNMCVCVCVCVCVAANYPSLRLLLEIPLPSWGGIKYTTGKQSIVSAGHHDLDEGRLKV